MCCMYVLLIIRTTRHSDISLRRFSLQQKEAALLAQYDSEDKIFTEAKSITFYIESEDYVYITYGFMHFL